MRSKGELSKLLKDEAFGKADVIQLVELVMDKFDAPETLRRGTELSVQANPYSGSEA